VLLGGERCLLLGSRGVDGVLAGTAAPMGSAGMSDSEKDAPWKPGLGVRQLACCSPSLWENIILLLSEEAEKYIRRWLRGCALQFCLGSRSRYCFIESGGTVHVLLK